MNPNILYNVIHIAIICDQKPNQLQWVQSKDSDFESFIILLLTYINNFQFIKSYSSLYSCTDINILHNLIEELLLTQRLTYFYNKHFKNHYYFKSTNEMSNEITSELDITDILNMNKHYWIRQSQHIVKLSSDIIITSNLVIVNIIEYNKSKLLKELGNNPIGPMLLYSNNNTLNESLLNYLKYIKSKFNDVSDISVIPKSSYCEIIDPLSYCFINQTELINITNNKDITNITNTKDITNITNNNDMTDITNNNDMSDITNNNDIPNITNNNYVTNTNDVKFILIRRCIYKLFDFTSLENTPEYMIDKYINNIQTSAVNQINNIDISISNITVIECI